MATTLLVGALAATGCSGDDSPAPVTVEVGQVEQVPATALDLDSDARVALPSGVLSLSLATDVGTVSADGAEVSGAEGTTLLGVGWSFEAHPSSDARDVLLDGGSPSDLPQPTVTVLDGPDGIDVPVAAKAGGAGAAVVGVEAPTGLEVAYDGAVQTVDLATGTVGTGPAEAFLDLAGTASPVRRACPAGDFSPTDAFDHGCRVEQVYRLPWIAGLGWADDAGTWLVVEARVRGDATMRLGDDPGTQLGSAPASLRRVAFAAGGTAPPRVDFDFGSDVGVVSVPLPR